MTGSVSKVVGVALTAVRLQRKLREMKEVGSV